MNKFKDNMELKEVLNNMEIGDVIKIEFNDVTVDYITKTTWFETTVFILGGSGRIGIPRIVGWGIEEINDDIDVVIANIYETLNENVKSVDTNGKIKIRYKSDEEFCEGISGNFYYDNDEI